MARTAEVRRLGYDDRFIRLWEYYLAYCEAAFLERCTGVVQMLATRPACRIDAVGAGTADTHIRERRRAGTRRRGAGVVSLLLMVVSRMVRHCRRVMALLWLRCSGHGVTLASSTSRGRSGPRRSACGSRWSASGYGPRRAIVVAMAGVWGLRLGASPAAPRQPRGRGRALPATPARVGRPRPAPALSLLSSPGALGRALRRADARRRGEHASAARVARCRRRSDLDRRPWPARRSPTVNSRASAPTRRIAPPCAAPDSGATRGTRTTSSNGCTGGRTCSWRLARRSGGFH